MYGVLNELDDLGRIGFFAFNILLPFGIYFGGKILNNAIWRNRVLDSMANEGRKKSKRT